MKTRAQDARCLWSISLNWTKVISIFFWGQDTSGSQSFTQPWGQHPIVITVPVYYGDCSLNETMSWPLVSSTSFPVSMFKASQMKNQSVFWGRMRCASFGFKDAGEGWDDLLLWKLSKKSFSVLSFLLVLAVGCIFRPSTGNFPSLPGNRWSMVSS